MDNITKMDSITKQIIENIKSTFKKEVDEDIKLFENETSIIETKCI